MKPGRLLIGAGALIAIVIALVVSGGGDDDKSGGDGPKAPTPAKAEKDAVRVTFAYSPEKDKLLAPLVERFNAEAVEVDGRPVFVEATNQSSGDVQAKIAKGTYEPVAWSPSSS